jgi:hypothetical protein
MFFLMLMVGEMLSEIAVVFIRYHARRCFAHQGGGASSFWGNRSLLERSVLAYT